MARNARTDPVRDPSITELSPALRAAISRIYSRFRSERGEGEIGDGALLTLGALDNHGPLTLKQLSDRAHVTPGSMSQTVNRLAAGGYVVRGPDPEDGRRVLFSTTPAGAELARAALTHRLRWLDASLGQLTAEERLVLLRAATILQKIADS